MILGLIVGALIFFIGMLVGATFVIMKAYSVEEE